MLKDFVDEFKSNVEKLFKELTRLLRGSSGSERVKEYTIRSFGMVDDSSPIFLLEDMMHLILHLEQNIRRHESQSSAYFEAKSALLSTLTTHEVAQTVIIIIALSSY